MIFWSLEENRMHYVISDIHGCCEEFKRLLKLIQFSDDDIVYVIGDVIDRGPDPVGVLEIMSSYYNIVPIVGNHEYIMLKTLPYLLEEIRKDNIETVLTTQFLQSYQLWINDGGKATIDAFRKLSKEDVEFYLDYVREFALYEEVSVNGKEFFLSHSLPKDFDASNGLNYTIEEMIFSRPDFNSDWSQEIVYIIGHTPTISFGTEYAGKIFRKDNLIDIDCGCVSGYRLCAYCLETEQAYYVNYA